MNPWMAALAALIVLTAFGSVARAPSDMLIDPDTAAWFKSLHQPTETGETGMGCCAEADCERVDARQRPDGWEVYVDLANGRGGINRKWEPVPSAVILQNKDNPTGLPVACIVGQKIFCFVRPPET